MIGRLSGVSRLTGGRGNNQDAGYSLMEVLVMLAITAIVSALVLQTVRSASATGLRIERHVRSTLHDRLDVNALRHAVAGTLVTYSDTNGGFAGDDRQASGLTARTIGLDGQGVQPYRLTVEDEGRGSALYYEEGGERFEVVRLPEGRLQLSYFAGRRSGDGWSADWPPAGGFVALGHGQAPYYRPIPRVLRVSGPGTEPTVDLFLGLPQTQPPRPRVSDYIEMVQ
jgi:type II secretory pathway pseudopilin PulG